MTTLPPFREKIEAFLQKRESSLRLRCVESTARQWERPLDLSSNDYLNLSQHPALKENAARFVAKYGCGARASRVISGSLPCYPELEKAIARMKGKEAALILNTGYQANVTLLSALIDRHTLVFADRFCHHSLLEGVRLGGGKLFRYRHLDLFHLEELIQKALAKSPLPSPRLLIVTESVFGMDGDCTDLAALIRLKERYQALLYVDEAHATGVLGPQGRGLAADLPQVDVVMGTFSKALGAFGSYVACSERLKQYFVNACGGFIYSTALPPAALGAIEATLATFPLMHQERQGLLQKADWFRGEMKKRGWNYGASTTHLLPFLVGTEAAALKLFAFLQEEGIRVAVIRPPTVPQGQSRLRLALNCAISQEDLERLIVALEKGMR